MSPNTVAAVLDKEGVHYVRELHGFDVGNLRLQRGGGIAAEPGWFVHSIRTPVVNGESTPLVRSGFARNQKELRSLCRDYFVRYRTREVRETFGNIQRRVAYLPRLVDHSGIPLRKARTGREWVVLTDVEPRNCV